MAGTAIEVHGLTEFRKELRDVDKAAPKALKKAHTRIAGRTQSKARSNASSAGGAFAAAKTAIRGRATELEASIGVNRSTSQPFAQATFWGAKRRSGWYAADKFGESTGQQFPDWVGNNWEAARFDQGPYVINYTVAEELPRILDDYEQSVDEMFSAAFPNR